MQARVLGAAEQRQFHIRLYREFIKPHHTVRDRTGVCQRKSKILVVIKRSHGLPSRPPMQNSAMTMHDARINQPFLGEALGRQAPVAQVRNIAAQIDGGKRAGEPIEADAAINPDLLVLGQHHRGVGPVQKIGLRGGGIAIQLIEWIGSQAGLPVQVQGQMLQQLIRKCRAGCLREVAPRRVMLVGREAGRIKHIPFHTLEFLPEIYGGLEVELGIAVPVAVVGQGIIVEGARHTQPELQHVLSQLL